MQKVYDQGFSYHYEYKGFEIHPNYDLRLHSGRREDRYYYRPIGATYMDGWDTARSLQQAKDLIELRLVTA